MEFVFIHNKKKYKKYAKIRDKSNVEGEYEVTGYYFIYHGYIISVNEKRNEYIVSLFDAKRLINEGVVNEWGNVPDFIAEKLGDEINEGNIPLHYGPHLKYFIFELPTEPFGTIFDYIAFMIYEGKIIGYYRGALAISKGRLCSKDSFIEIRSDFQGKGLCKPLASFTYCSLSDKLGVKCIKIWIATLNPNSACYCYIEAAEKCGYRTFWKEKQVGDELCSSHEFKEESLKQLLFLK